MEQLKTMKQTLTAQVQSQMGNLQQVDAKELGEAVDMIKDLAEAIYYCTITEAMENKEEPQNNYYYTEHYHNQPYYDRKRDMDYGRMYYSGGGGSNGGSNNSNSSSGGYSSGRGYYTEREIPFEMRDQREGRSPMSRRMYMESKEMHKTQEVKMKDLEKYVQELSSDITEMIEDASPEEKQLLQKKITTLAAKINV